MVEQETIIPQAAQLSLEHIVLGGVDSELHRFHGTGQLELYRKDPDIVASKRDQYCYYEATFEYWATNRRKEKVWSATLKLIAFYVADVVITSEAIQANMVAVLRHLHDYQREQLHWLTLQMGLPPLLIDTFRLTDGG